MPARPEPLCLEPAASHPSSPEGVGRTWSASFAAMVSMAALSLASPSSTLAGPLSGGALESVRFVGENDQQQVVYVQEDSAGDGATVWVADVVPTAAGIEFASAEGDADDAIAAGLPETIRASSGDSGVEASAGEEGIRASSGDSGVEASAGEEGIRASSGDSGLVVHGIGAIVESDADDTLAVALMDPAGTIVEATLVDGGGATDLGLVLTAVDVQMLVEELEHSSLGGAAPHPALDEVIVSLEAAVP